MQGICNIDMPQKGQNNGQKQSHDKEQNTNIYYKDTLFDAAC